MSISNQSIVNRNYIENEALVPYKYKSGQLSHLQLPYLGKGLLAGNVPVQAHPCLRQCSIQSVFSKRMFIKM